MSKLYQTYAALKMQDSSQLYLFKSCIFYIFLDEDAKLISTKFNLKLTNLNSIVVKCGFPTSQIEKYTNLFNIANISFKIVDVQKNELYSPKDFILDKNILSFLQKISSTNAYDLSISEAYDFIESISKESKIFIGDYNNGKK